MDSAIPTWRAENAVAIPDGDAYLLTTDGVLHGPYRSLELAATRVFGDVPGVVQFALNAGLCVVMVRAQRSPAIWFLAGEIRLLDGKRTERIIDFFRKALVPLDATVVIAPRQEVTRHVTSVARLPIAFDRLQRRHLRMRVKELMADEVKNAQLSASLVEAWVNDQHEWGESINSVIDQFKINTSIVAVNVQTMTFEWSGASLTLLDKDPSRLLNAPITSLSDKAFVDGIIVDLKRATATPNPYLCRISTPLNGVLVEYDILSLPLKSQRNDEVVSCLRIPLELTLNSPPPAYFDPDAGPLATTLLIGDGN